MEHKRGDSFDYTATVPGDFADGYFAGWTVTSQVRNAKTGVLVAELGATWTDPATTRALRLLALDTSAWTIGQMKFDVRLRRDSDGYTLSTSTVLFNLVEGVTQP